MFDSFDLTLLDELKKNDPRTYWQLLAKLMPRHVKAEVGEIGSIGEACDAALKRAGLTMKTQLGDVDG